MKRWRGVLVQENVQTGDGRVIAAGACEWGDLPLPLALLDGDQHGMPAAGPVIGNIDRIERTGNDVMGFGVIDDLLPEGAEMIRRLEAGTAPFGNRWGLSIDGDNWEVQVVDTNPAEGDPLDGLLLLASGGGRYLPGALRRTLSAAAGDPDVEPSPEQILFEDASDGIIERATRMRIRGVTACAVPAFDGAYLELDPDPAPAAPVDPEAPTVEPAPEPAAPEPVAASAAPALPAAAWFRFTEADAPEDAWVNQGDGKAAIPLTVTDHGQVFGHLAVWGTCHVGFPGECITAPDSPSSYARFQTGTVRTDSGDVSVGQLVIGCDHADLALFAQGARDHYANAGTAWADVSVVDGEAGPWIAGAVRPGLDPAQLRAVRASGVSGDWRAFGPALDLVGILSVNVRGFPVLRDDVARLVASATLPVPEAAVGVRMGDDGPVALVAAGRVERCSECEAARRAGTSGTVLTASPDPRLDRALAVLDRLDRRTAHMDAEVAARLAARIASA